MKKDTNEPLIDNYSQNGDDGPLTTQGSYKAPGSESEQEDEGYLRGLPQMEKDYGNLFRDLTISKRIKMKMASVNAIITYDSKHVVSICCDENV